ncbi:MAG: hypothetical protein IPN86_04450 [Saprospiraceae bacterium]|nr:hypothetical protein [Saprospiraceae bacterium]
MNARKWIIDFIIDIDRHIVIILNVKVFTGIEQPKALSAPGEKSANILVLVKSAVSGTALQVKGRLPIVPNGHAVAAQWYKISMIQINYCKSIGKGHS